MIPTLYYSLWAFCHVIESYILFSLIGTFAYQFICLVSLLHIIQYHFCMLSDTWSFCFKHTEPYCNVQAVLQLLDTRDSPISTSKEHGTTSVYNLKQN